MIDQSLAQLAANDFTNFKVLIDNQYTRAPHVDLIDTVLMEVARYLETGKGIRRVIIEAPPRHSKSLTVSQMFPAWLMGRNPWMHVILASYSASLAEVHSRAARNYVSEPLFKDIFPQTSLREDIARADEWGVTDGKGKKGMMVAVGMGGSVVGKGAHCFPADTLVETEIGQMRIDELCSRLDKPRVWTYNVERERLELENVTATSVRFAEEFIEIETAGGVKITSTPEHPIYIVGRGYIPAGELEGNETLYTNGASDVFVLRQRIRQAVTRSPKGVEEQLQGHVLLQRMFSESSRDQELPEMSALRQTCINKENVLLSCLPKSGSTEETHKALRILWRGVHTCKLAFNVLYETMRRQITLAAYDRFRQLTLQRRNECNEVVRSDASVDYRAGSLLRRLWMLRRKETREMGVTDSDAVNPRNPPHQRGHTEQHAGEFDNTLSSVPYAAPQVASDAVSMVRRVRKESQRVYDFRVEGNHNFFANEILVHNCLIIDDPHKNRAEVESDVIREGVKTSYTNDLLSRFNDSNRAAQIVMAQRYHTDDLIGWLLDTQPGKWVHLRLPALAEADDPLGREEGEPLWPERFNKEALEEKRIELGSYAFESQYQQRPIPKGEAVFETEKIEIIDKAPPHGRAVRYYDLAVTTKKKSDYTVGLKMALAENGDLIVLDVFRDKVKAPVLLDTTKKIAAQDTKACSIALEHEKSGISQLDYMLADPFFHGYTMTLNPISGDKFTRALAVMTRVNLGAVKLVKAHWNQGFLDELKVFPSGRHDDQVDAFSGAYDYLTNQVLPMFEVANIGKAEDY